MVVKQHSFNSIIIIIILLFKRPTTSWGWWIIVWKTVSYSIKPRKECEKLLSRFKGPSWGLTYEISLTTAVLGLGCLRSPCSVSYTHLDVYKRQRPHRLISGLYSIAEYWSSDPTLYYSMTDNLSELIEPMEIVTQDNTWYYSNE